MKRVVPKIYSNLLVRWKSTFDGLHGVLYPSKEVENALRNMKPILALESTIITHGMPFPTNLDTAIQVEDIVRRNGAIPATIAVVDGFIKIGLSTQELESLSRNKNAVKISRRDLALATTKKLSGGTTVSATMLVAHKAGIKCFATGGIGGVHREAEVTFDISADLRELGRTPVTVFSSGIKSILDIEKSLEYLETEGVSVTVLKNFENDEEDTDFPGFYTSKSGFKVPYCLQNIKEAAALIHNQELLQLQNGILIAIPVPQGLDRHSINEAINLALAEAKEKMIKGKNITPFVLQKINELTAGESLKTNVALIKHNVNIASQVVCELNVLKQQSVGVKVTRCEGLKGNTENVESDNHSIVVIGGSILDTMLCVNEETISLDSMTVPGIVRRSVGGVARNLADCINRLGHNPTFISCVGDDSEGRMILKRNQNLDTRGIKICTDVPTSMAYLTMDFNGETKLTILDTRANQRLTKDHIAKYQDYISKASLVVIDANIPLLAIEFVLNVCFESGVPVFYEPTDPRIAANIFQIKSQSRNCVFYASPNLLELQFMFKALNNGKLERMTSKKDIQQQCQYLAEHILDNCFQTLLITLGPNGNVIISKRPLSECLQLGPNLSFTTEKCDKFINFFPVERIPKADIVSFSGAGDCFVSGFISGMIRGKNVKECIELGQMAAKISIKSIDTVPIEIESINNYF